MKILAITLFIVAALPLLAQPKPTKGQVVRLDPRFDKLVPKDAVPEVLCTGFEWAEGPVWVKATATEPGYLLFSDVPKNTVFRWTDAEGCRPFLMPSGYTGRGTYSDEPGSNGLTLDAQGRLISCEHGDRRVSAMPLNGVGGKITLADRYQGKRFNSPNDVVAHANGSYYFTDPPYGLAKKENDPSRETSLFGVYRVDPAGVVSLLVKDLLRPNGIAFSPDQQTMYIGQSYEQRPVIMAYPVQKDGSVGAGRLVYDVSPLWKLGLKGAPDGLKVDQQGNIWSSGPGGVIVLAVDPKTSAGTLLGRIETGEATANCGWGDDGSTLYITADAYLLRLKTTARGAGW